MHKLNTRIYLVVLRRPIGWYRLPRMYPRQLAPLDDVAPPEDPPPNDAQERQAEADEFDLLLY